MTKKQKIDVANLLDSRYDFLCEDDCSPADKAYYEGMLVLLDRAKIDWERDEFGNHKIY